MSDDDRSDRYRAPALDKGLDILEVLAAEARGLTRAEIVRALGLGPSQIYRMLERLVARGYVARLDGDRHILTMKLFLLATAHPPYRRLVAEAQPLMDAFAARTRQSCHLVVPESGAGVVAAQASPRENWEFRVRQGARLDLFETGSGLALLAFQHPQRRERTLAIWGIRPDDPRLAAVAPQLAAIREAGHRQAASGQLVGVLDQSVPVRGPDGDALAVLTCPFIELADRPGQPAAAEVLAQLQSLAAELSSEAGFRS